VQQLRSGTSAWRVSPAADGVDDSAAAAAAAAVGLQRLGMQ